MSVVDTHEDITKNPEGSNLRGHVEAQESTDALGLTLSANLEDVLLGGEGELFTGELEGDGGHMGDLLKSKFVCILL